MKHCVHCGKPLKDHANFCNYCGRECGRRPKPGNQPGKKNYPQKRSGFALLATAAAAIIICLAAAVFLWNMEKITLVGSASDATVQSKETEKDTDSGKRKLLKQVNMYADDVLKEVVRFSYNEKDLIEKVTVDCFENGSKDTILVTTLTYDAAGRLIESKDVPSNLPDETGSSAVYTYGDEGRLIRKACKESWGEWTETYEYDSQGYRTKSIREEGDTALVIDYDRDGNPTGGTFYVKGGAAQTVTEMPWLTHTLYDGQYRPFTIGVYEYVCEYDPAVFARIEDVMGNKIFGLSFYEPDFTEDDDGYMVKAKDGALTCEFYYDGDTLQQEPSAQPLTTATELPKADGKLNYPISEKDCYVIYKNYFGQEMDWCDKVEVERYGEGDEEMLMFSLMVEMIEGEPLYLWGFFNVYVNTGVCTGGAQGHADIWPVFQADDYYY